MKQKNYYFYTNILAWALVLLLIGSYAFGWVTPTQNPPEGDLSIPLDISSTAQTKTGDLTVDSLLKVGRYVSAPTGSTGALYYDTTENQFKGYTASSWDSLGAADTDTWITTQTCSTDYALQSVGKESKVCINKVDYSDVAYDVSCTNCLTNVEVASADTATTASTAFDLSCTDCIGTTEIADSYVLNTSDVMSGTLTVAGLDVSGTINIPADTWIIANGINVIRDSYFGYSGSYRALHIGGTLSATRGIAIGIDPTSISGGAFTGHEIGFPNSVEFMQANSGSTDWIQSVLVLNNGNVGIGDTTPDYKLDVAGTLGTDGDVTIGGGSGKLNVGTIDPIYTINGKQYATYLPGMIGVKEETTGVINLQKSQDIYSYIIDFDDLEKGSDLWLFAKTTNLEENFDKITVLLTPAFDGKVWYDKNINGNRLAIFAVPNSIPDSNLEVSYRITAPRFDYDQWTNYSDSKSEGFNLDKLLK